MQTLLQLTYQTNFLLLVIVALLCVIVATNNRLTYNRATSRVDEIYVRVKRGETYKTIRDYSSVGYKPVKVNVLGEVVEVRMFKNESRPLWQGSWS